MDKVLEELHREFDGSGFKSSIIPIQRLSDVQFDLGNLLEEGLLCRGFYDEIISRYDLHWNFEPPADFPEAQSIVVVAAPQPKVSVSFKLSGRTYSVVIPPTYLHDSDEKASDIVSLHLGNHGYGVCDAMLPEKLLAVHCGLAAYGRNNVAYMDDWGSFFRLKTFFSDIPYSSDHLSDWLYGMPGCLSSE
jgi:epoxyqueuosine reductase